MKFIIWLLLIYYVSGISLTLCKNEISVFSSLCSHVKQLQKQNDGMPICHSKTAYVVLFRFYIVRFHRWVWHHILLPEWVLNRRGYSMLMRLCWNAVIIFTSCSMNFLRSCYLLCLSVAVSFTHVVACFLSSLSQNR